MPNRFAGSILDLEPDTEYETRLTMKDPDDVAAHAIQTANVRTRAGPKAAAGGRTMHVYPLDFKGAKQQPAFTGMNEAYYGSRSLRCQRLPDIESADRAARFAKFVFAV